MSVEEFPEFCLCPVTREVMSDPVIVDASCHQTVDRSALETWVGRGESTCPACGVALRSRAASPNVPLREAIEHFRAPEMPPAPRVGALRLSESTLQELIDILKEEEAVVARCRVRPWGWGTYIGGFNGRRKPHGVGTVKWDNGYEREGDWKDGLMDGRGTTHCPNGEVQMSMLCAGKILNGVRWSADRRTAWRMEQKEKEDYAVLKKITQRRAEELAAQLGLSVPE